MYKPLKKIFTALKTGLGMLAFAGVQPDVVDEVSTSRKKTLNTIVLPLMCLCMIVFVAVFFSWPLFFTIVAVSGFNILLTARPFTFRFFGKIIESRSDGVDFVRWVISLFCGSILIVSYADIGRIGQTSLWMLLTFVAVL